LVEYPDDVIDPGIIPSLDQRDRRSRSINALLLQLATR